LIDSFKSKLQAIDIADRALLDVVFLILVYAVLIFVLPPSQSTMTAYNVDASVYHSLQLLVAVPTFIVWITAFLGAAALRQYAALISQSPEGAHFKRLAEGCAWLAWSFPLAAITALLLSAIAETWTSMYATSIIISNYVNLILPLIAFSVIGIATRGLISSAKLKLSVTTARLIVGFFLAAGITYCYLVFRHFDPITLSGTNNPYFLPIWLMVLTVIVPYLYIWFIGMLTAYEITLVSQKIIGVWYRQALRLLASGLAAIIISSIALQYLNSAQPRVGHLLLNYRLVLNILFRLVGAAGFILLAVGANKLKKIEEV
jgi:hypothetical protein